LPAKVQVHTVTLIFLIDLPPDITQSEQISDDYDRSTPKGLHDEQRMHSAYLKPLSFQLPARAESFHKQWSELTQRLTDEDQVGRHPAEFSTAVKPLLEGPLSEASIAGMFEEPSTTTVVSQNRSPKQPL
jgi:hypothetical protein